MISNTWRITDMICMPYKTINYYVCCALVYNMSGSKVFYEQPILYTMWNQKARNFKPSKPFKLEYMAAGDGVLQFNK